MAKDRSSQSLVAFAVYLVGMGFGLVFVPNLLLGLFGFPTVEGPWVRIVGFLCWVLAYYYTRVARAGFEPFYRWTVHTRLCVLPFFVALVMVDLAPPVLILFGVLELGFTLWTWSTLGGVDS